MVKVMEEEKNIVLEQTDAQEGVLRGATLLGAPRKDMFEVEHIILNEIEDVKFPGNISPEGYFYSPFYEVMLKELEDELQFVSVKRINFKPSEATVTSRTVNSYNPETGSESAKTVYFIKIKSPLLYKVIQYQPFVIYDVSKDETNRGYLYEFSGTDYTIATEVYIKRQDLQGGQYIISLIEENAPEYAEFIPSSQRLVWRGPKKMSDLESTSPIYNMPFTNGRNYIHKNINVFVRRQDPQGEFKLFRPSSTNPLRRFQVEGNGKIDMDYVQYITDTMIDAC